MLKRTLNRVKTFLLNQLQERPLETIVALASLVGAIFGGLDKYTKYQNSRTWRKEVKRREKLTNIHS